MHKGLINFYDRRHNQLVGGSRVRGAGYGVGGNLVRAVVRQKVV